MASHQCWPTTKKESFLGESQRTVRRLSNQISSFRLETHLRFFDLPATNIYVPLQNSRLFTYGIISSEGVSKLRFSFQRGAMETQHSTNI